MDSARAVALSGLSVLVVEDEVLLRRRLTAHLETLGADVTGAETLDAARRLLSELDFDFALLDINLPDGSGMDLLRQGAFAPSTSVVVMTAHGNVAGAVEAMRLGAADYLVKPFEPEELPLVLSRARRGRQVARAQAHRHSDVARDGFFFGTALAPLKAQLDKILAADRRLTGTPPPVLIQGETGTGKTAIARWLHQQGPRAERELVEVNCATLPETLAESELFGHERGAFTDARAARMGLFEAAHGGTLFLDELPTLSPALQAKVLTAIEDGCIRRVGSNKSIPVDVRIVAATQHDLKTLVATGQMREDLYHRLDLYRVVIPPLRERGQDIVALAAHFLRQLSRKYRLPLKKISEAGRQRLLTYAWPGNVRELAHELERAVVFEDADEYQFAHLPGCLEVTGSGTETGEQPDWLVRDFRFPEHGFSLEEAINRFVRLALKQTDGNVSAAARLLGMPRDFVRYRLGQKGRRPNGP